MSIIINLIGTLTHITEELGYLGIFSMMVIEYACIPFPSEFILPFIGFGILVGKYNLWITLTIIVVGGIIGASIGYSIGFCGGKVVINWIEKKIPNSKKAFAIIREAFVKYGKITVFVARILPLTRTYVSLFAGAEKFNKSLFLIFSSLGITIWSTVLLGIGYYIGDNEQLIKILGEKYAITVVSIIVFLIGSYLIYKNIKKRQAK